jgi:hypothetical protein
MNTKLYFSEGVLISSHYLYGIEGFITYIRGVCIFLVGMEDQKLVLLSYIEDASLTSVQQISTVPRRVRIREWTLESWMVILYVALMNTTVQLN